MTKHKYVYVYIALLLLRQFGGHIKKKQNREIYDEGYKTRFFVDRSTLLPTDV
jgi:hypothetical protein